MLSVQRYQPLLPMHNQASSSRRHQQQHIVERGRSRNVSQAALARRRSEERRRRAAAIFTSHPSLSIPRATSPPVRSEKANTKQWAPSIHNTPTTFENIQPVASSSSCRLPSPQPPPPTPTYQPMLNGDDSDCAATSTAETSHSRHQPHCVTREPYPVPVYSLFDEGEESPSSEHSMSLQDEMQGAYAACQTSCLPSPGNASVCRCPSMRRARVLYLKTQGIDVTSDDDPRIDQVRDEDFVFVPGGEFVLDEESLAALNEERARREKEAEKNKWRVRGHTWDTEAERAREPKALTQRAKEEARTASHTPQRLEFKAKRGRTLRANPASHIRQCADTPQPVPSSLRIELVPTFRSNRNCQTAPTGTTPCRVSFKEVYRSLHGSLFLDTEVQRAGSTTQDELLGALLQTVVWQEGERRRVKSKAKLEVPPRKWTDSQLCQTPEADSACVACSVSSDSTISRTNSWASTTSDASSTTCITSPPSSPNLNKLQLPPLVDDKLFQKQIVHSCRSHRKNGLTAVSLIETPLLRDGNDVLAQDTAKTARRPSRERKDECVKSPLVQRVRQSVFGLVDFASRMQQSYLRTMQLSVGFQQDISPAPASHSRPRAEGKGFKPQGYRANARDVQRFAPQPTGPPTRELNFPSEHNIPLGDPCDSQADSGSSSPARVFAPLAFVPPSPLRPREAPTAPEWRLRPVANPCTLRLKALANQLSGKGIAWEGRAHTGSLGCGRERLTGVAFEGLGGSRLAFEAR